MSAGATSLELERMRLAGRMVAWLATCSTLLLHNRSFFGVPLGDLLRPRCRRF
jgi:hypothetical protein